MPGPTTSPATPYISFSEIEQRVRLQDLREALRKYNVPDATADIVLQRQRQWFEYIGTVARQSYVGSTTTFLVRGVWGPFNGERAYGVFSFDFPPNDPKYLAEFVRALNYPHLMVWIQALIPDALVQSGRPRPIIEYMDVFPDWELNDREGFRHSYWNEVKIDRDFNEVKIRKTKRLNEFAF